MHLDPWIEVFVFHVSVLFSVKNTIYGFIFFFEWWKYLYIWDEEAPFEHPEFALRAMYLIL